MRVRGGAERGTPINLGVRGGPEKNVGGSVGRQRILRGSNEVSERPGGRGGGGGVAIYFSSSFFLLARMKAESGRGLGWPRG